MPRIAKEIPVAESRYLRRKMLEFMLNGVAALSVVADSDMFGVILGYLNPAELRRAQAGQLRVPILAEAICCEDEVGICLPDTARRMQRHWVKASRAQREAFISYFRGKQRALSSNTVRPEQYLRLLDQVRQAYKLSDCACDIITMEYLSNADRMFHEALSAFRRNAGPHTRVRDLCKVLGRPAAEIANEVGGDGRLRRFGLVDHDNDMDRQLAEFLAGQSSTPLVSRLFHQCTEDILDLSAHRTHQAAAAQIMDIIRSRGTDAGVNILLYGTPGTGKTALARSIGKALALRIIEMNRACDASGDRKSGSAFRYGAVSACLNSVNTDQSLIIVDEADDLLNCGDQMMLFFTARRDSEKAVINTLMDTHKAAVIWITNAHDSIPESTRRRFDYSLAFSTFTRQQRQGVWENSLARHDVSVFKPEDVADLVSRYEINAGGIELAVRHVKRIVNAAADAEAARTKALGTVRSVLAAHMKLMAAAPSSQNARENARDYSLEGLSVHSDPPLAEIVDILGRFTEYLRTSQTGTSPSSAAAGIRNMNLLLSGPPGSGKTEFAKFLARQLDQPLVVKRASDLLDCYVGNTEKRIRQQFETAVTEQAILFIDEVDSLLAARGKAVRSWEVTQVNELLSAMESFNGIFICATNFRANLDPAALRRFNLKVDFDYLNNEGKSCFYRRYLESLTGQALTAGEHAMLAEIDGLTPGDFKVVWQKHAFMQPAGMSTARILAALAAEAAAKPDRGQARKVGFCSAVE